ncbi:MAG: alkaline phosphatase [Thermomicrobiales bacterium]|jgi:phosphodiesterase/alkaline phosphatase D-like protein|nr:alkaline phosphatase [Thermomicrobiales bacterium]MEA2523378.1 alkaline phosphatase [Thermomicrobiales bacterium]
MQELKDQVFPDGELDEAVELGAVTDRSVRVWVRHPGGEQMPVRLEVDGHEAVGGVASVSADSDWTGAVELTLPNAAPDRPFAVLASGRRLTGQFAPSAGTHDSFAFGFGSCHWPFATGSDGRVRLRDVASIYPAIQSELSAADARFLLLIGDQIYADGLPSISVRDNLPGDEEHPPPLELATRAYRHVTRGYFGESGFRRLRETFPTLCMWDDHDIFQDWGSRLKESPLDRLLFQAASRVFVEYQHQRNPADLASGDEPPYSFFYQFGTAGFLVLDIRGKRDYTDGRLLGREQWEMVQTFFKSEEARALHTLFVVASVPIAHVSRWMVEAFQRLPWERADDVRDRWCARAFIASRDEFLDQLFTWQTAEKHRQAIVLSGDVHAASAFTIRNRRRPGVVRQFTSSAFTSPLVGMTRYLNWLGTRAPNLFELRLRFRRHFVTLENNYGLVRLEALPEGGHRIEFNVRAWHPRQRRLKPGGRVVVAPEGMRAAEPGVV